MKSLLICPAERPALARLTCNTPFVAIPWMGKSLLEYWLEHLARQGATEVRILATDRPEVVRAQVGDGARWGLRATVQTVAREWTPEQARAQYFDGDPGAWLPEPNAVVLLDHFPGLPALPLLKQEAALMAALEAMLMGMTPGHRVGLREIQPGVWAGLRTRIAPTAQLRAPCWLGDGVRIGPHAVVGPLAWLEDRVVVGRAATVTHSWVGADTLAGDYVAIHNSLARGEWLINWHTGSALQVPDRFLLSGLNQSGLVQPVVHWMGRMAALLLMELTLPLGLAAMLRARLRGEPPFREKKAVHPGASRGADTLAYYELNCVNQWLKRWPQLWSVATGEFRWIGNRPLSPERARELTNAFERRWLEAPVGLISLADAHGCVSLSSDEARAHASYYAARANWRLNLSICLRFIGFLGLSLVAKSRRELAAEAPVPVSVREQGANSNT